MSAHFVYIVWKDVDIVEETEGEEDVEKLTLQESIKVVKLEAPEPA